MLNPIFITGYMAAGKSTFGKRLAAKMGLTFRDLDKEIEREEGQNIQEIFEERGEAQFRELEAAALRRLSLPNTVIATGGGAACHAGNIDWMNQYGVTIFLNTPEKVIVQRLMNSTNRPLLDGIPKEENAISEFVQEHLEERLPYYQQSRILFNPISGKLDKLPPIIEVLSVTKRALAS